MSGKSSTAKVLKSKGLIPAKWDLRKPLSAGQKSWVTKQAGKFADVVKRPGEFTTAKLRSAKEIKIAQAQGFRTSGNRLVAKGTKIRRSKGRLVVSTVDGEREYFTSDAAGFSSLLSDCRSIRLTDSQVWALQIGGNELNDQFSDFDDLMSYYRSVNWDNPATSGFVTFVLISED